MSYHQSLPFVRGGVGRNSPHNRLVITFYVLAAPGGSLARGRI